jgi:hypothetical protein
MTNCSYEKIHVECHSGYRANERPIAFTYRNERLEIRDIMDRWYEGGRDACREVIDYFKVRTADGEIYILRYLSAFDSWTIHV